jgi:hypothetical protein
MSARHYQGSSARRFPTRTRYQIFGYITVGAGATRFATLKNASDAAGSLRAALFSFERYLGLLTSEQHSSKASLPPTIYGHMVQLVTTCGHLNWPT